MSQSKKNLFEVSLKVERIDPDQIILSDAESEIVLPKRYLPKSFLAGHEVVLTIESAADRANKTAKSAKEILKEILNP